MLHRQLKRERPCFLRNLWSGFLVWTYLGRFREVNHVLSVARFLGRWDKVWRFIVNSVIMVLNPLPHSTLISRMFCWAMSSSTCVWYIFVFWTNASVWCSRTCSRKDEPHSTEHKLLTCPCNNPSWNTYPLFWPLRIPVSHRLPGCFFSRFLDTSDHSFLRFVVETENWHGGLAMGYIWSRMVCFAGESAAEIAGSSLFAEMVGSFSTVSQEKRHENLPSWYGSPHIPNTTLFPCAGEVILIVSLVSLWWGWIWGWL